MIGAQISYQSLKKKPVCCEVVALARIPIASIPGTAYWWLSKMTKNFMHFLRWFGVGLAVVVLAGCAGDRRHHMVISATDQQMVLLRDEKPVAYYPVSTSKFGLGDGHGTNTTPIGRLHVKKKIGDGAPAGAVFKSRAFTGEVLPVDAPGRDPIVTRILWLDGHEDRNRNAFERYIYIHGTPEERNIGKPVSYGCIRMRSRDVIALYEMVGVGARVTILPGPLPQEIKPPAPPIDPA
jgi:hypothetical protein